MENSQNTTLTFLFGAVLTDDFWYGAVLTENWGRFGLGPFSIGAVLTGNPVGHGQESVSRNNEMLKSRNAPVLPKWHDWWGNIIMPV